MYNNLEEIITNLINSGIEGEYWDFKQKWHKDNEELIRDILSFANTIHNKDCFLIIGVSDNCEIIGVENDENRRKQVNILDMLGNCNFAGQNTPIINVETLNVENKELDILIIYNTNNVPMYISKRNKKQHRLQENFIYSRVGDRNTPMNENSNIYIIEQLWRKRFGLNRDSIELFKEALKDKWNWNVNREGWYYKFNPEFSIKVIYDDSLNRSGATAFYSYNMTNESTTFYNLQLIYKGTVLDEFQKVVLDGGRYSTISPKAEYVKKSIHSDIYEYRYFIKETLEYLLYDFLYREEHHKDDYFAKLNFDDIVIFFNNDDEYENFKIYAHNNLSELIENTKGEIECCKERYEDYSVEKISKEKIVVAKYFKKMFLDFKNRR
ncbi:ATP-binding protein [Clostridium perfringens]|uniref:ATP-binding protein n=1 Tax=Clostridium perfringens TaxID=1502 RepID=UPI0013E30B79|nr:ATP-binding protein [Clostridium perfringens]MDK0543592.1 ATP-binding protein [Clostridium perfringens]MDK0646970.1 ATP-binding protein [Clostridium perfringens]MDK0827718.1 ATP-binding protein [Clostridium perfringens]MDM0489899.1 ATP-binding protein [Clostridium perfringens]MDM0589152.1 ATP-binding protein [Clostridium perfringens]